MSVEPKGVTINFSAYAPVDAATVNNFLENAKVVISKIQYKANEAIEMLRTVVQQTPLSPIVAKAYEISTQIEMTFNIAACLPFIGIAVSWLRILAAKIQLFAGAGIMVAGKAGYYISKYGQADETTLNKWKIIANYGAENVLHGCLNIIRGIGETLVSTLTLGLGSVALLVPNLITKTPFTPVIKYGDFIKPDLSDKLRQPKDDDLFMPTPKT